MSRQPRAFFALDFGSATTSAALVGHAGGRWRLLAHAAAPSNTDLDALLIGILDRVGQADRELLEYVAAQERPEAAALAADLARLESRSSPPRRIAVLAGSRRQRRRLEEVAARAGWLVVGGSADVEDPLALSRLVLAPDTDAVLLGADPTPAGDERRHLPMLGALVSAAARSRPELAVVLAGGAAVQESDFRGTGEHDRIPHLPATATAAGPVEAPAKTEAGTPPGPTDAAAPALTATKPGTATRRGAAAKALAAAAKPATSAARPAADVEPTDAAGQPMKPVPLTAAGPEQAMAANPVPTSSEHDSVLLAPDAESGLPAGAALQQVLEGLRARSDDSRLGIARSVRSLALLLDKSIEAVEVGLNGGLRSRAEPFGPGHLTVVTSHAAMAGGSFVPAETSDEVVDSVLSWSTVALDRYRLNDRLRDMRICPWGEADGEGALLRLAAAKAAVERLVAATPEISTREMPDILIAAGGVWASTPPSVVALAMADLVRRPGISRLACDQARLLGPLGAIADEEERRKMLRDLVEDALLPLGSLILPSGIRQGRSAGRMRVLGEMANSDIDLQPGGIWAVELPPGQTAIAEMDFRDAVRLGVRGRRFSVEVSGGLGGLFVDLRDIPLRLPDKADQKRATWEAWQRAMWSEIDE
ncbi:MAG: hypothetical protein ABSA21_07930 [Candidatus Limnocylindrales bacterium]